MIYKEKPDNFNPILEAVGCYVRYKGKILLLHRQDHRPEGNTWGLPAGKINAGEKPENAVIREIREETGMVIPASSINFLGKVYVRYPTYDSTFYVFETELKSQKEVAIDMNEHKNYKWVSPKNALDLELIEDLGEAIKIFC